MVPKGSKKHQATSILFLTRRRPLPVFYFFKSVHFLKTILNNSANNFRILQSILSQIIINKKIFSMTINEAKKSNIL